MNEDIVSSADQELSEETTVSTTPDVVETIGSYTEPMEEPIAKVTEPIQYEIPEVTESVYTDLAAITEATEPVYIEVIESSAGAIVHASLFGSFLVCGTLVGIFLLRGRYGT